MVATIGYLLGAFPPGKTDSAARRRVNEVMVDAHRKAVDAIRVRRARRARWASPWP